MTLQAPVSVKDYLDSLPADRRKTISAVRAVVRKHLPAGYKESMGFGVICWGVPLKTYPDTYNAQPLCYAALASQKNHCSLYLVAAYGDPAQRRALEDAFRKAGKTLDMGKSCVRFRTPGDLPLDAIGRLIGGMPVTAFIAMYEAARKKAR